MYDTFHMVETRYSVWSCSLVGVSLEGTPLQLMLCCICVVLK